MTPLGDGRPMMGAAAAEACGVWCVVGYLVSGVWWGGLFSIFFWCYFSRKIRDSGG
jgi:hypothetical protein